MSRLSKSRIMSALQCPKKAWLEVHRRELVKHSPQTLAAFETGHAVGRIAQQLYGGGAGVEIQWAGGSFGPALARTRDLLRDLLPVPVFEATLEHQGVLVREDILLPVADSWRVVEIKAATRLKPEYLQDCAIQAWVHLGAGVPLQAMALGHVDNQWTLGEDGRFEGFLVEQDLTGQVLDLQPSVSTWVEAARQAVSGGMPEVAVGSQCSLPNECPFLDFCWPRDSQYPVDRLGGGRKKLGALVAAAWRDIRDVPLSELSGTQLRIARVTRSGAAELLPGAGIALRALGHPRYCLDFETVGPAVPLWPGTRPYQALPFQYSCHIERRPGELEHVEFLDLSGAPPMRVLAERLIADLGEAGPVLMYTTFEAQVIRGLLELLPDLAGELSALLERLVDLHPIVKDHYYHPDMLGSWSIKAVLPTVAPQLDYAKLQGIAEGTAASAAYLEAIRPETDAQTRARIEHELLAYCRHDTMGMVELVRFFERS